MLPLAITTCKDAPIALVSFRYKDTGANATPCQAVVNRASTSHSRERNARSSQGCHRKPLERLTGAILFLCGATTTIYITGLFAHRRVRLQFCSTTIFVDLTGCLHVSFYDLLLIVPFGILAVWLKTLVTNLRIDHSV